MPRGAMLISRADVPVSLPSIPEAEEAAIGMPR